MDGSYALTESQRTTGKTNDTLSLYALCFYAKTSVPFTGIMRDGQFLKSSPNLSAEAIGCDKGKHPLVVISCPRDHKRTYYRERMIDKGSNRGGEEEWDFNKDKSGPRVDKKNGIFRNKISCIECQQEYGLDDWTCLQMCDWKRGSSEQASGGQGSIDEEPSASTGRNERHRSRPPASLPGMIPPPPPPQQQGDV